MMPCIHCQQDIDFTRGKAFTGYVHKESGQHVCADGKNLAEAPNYFDDPENVRAYERRAR